MSSKVQSYINLTKPRIVVLFAITGMITMVLTGTTLTGNLFHSVGILVAMMLTAASANSLNMVIDRKIDAIMDRTKETRPLPLNQLSVPQATIFGVFLGVTAVTYLLLTTNVLAASLSVFTIVFYVMVYTMWLKRTTIHNTLIGGVAGATAPLIGWAATTGEISALAWSMFLIIFTWSPPHFWALCITLKDDYAKAKIPMLPVVHGEKRTRFEILVYTIILIPVALLPYFMGDVGLVYAIGTVIASSFYLVKTIQMIRRKTHKACKELFHVSIAYITLLFVSLLVDHLYFIQ